MGRMNCNEDLIAANNITFAYQHGKQVLNGVNFRLPKGSVAAIVGPNGVGKSTILKILCGYLQPASGA